MKRTAAVLGPTPPFLRWAIQQDCALRDLDVDNLADQTFRQLRNVRELSNGYRENRVLEDICVHPAPIGDNSLVRAFHVDEVFDFFGDEPSLTQRCGSCPANCNANLKTDWAGCYGLLPVDLNFTFGHTQKSEVMPTDDLIALVDQAMLEENGFYYLWPQKWVQEQSVVKLASIFDSVAALRPQHQRLSQFADACKRCADNNMRLFVEFVPSGFSDGIHWKLNRACENCRFESQTPREKGTPCPVCKNRHPDDLGRKAKVLGLRPYLLLERVLGKVQTQEFVARYETYRSNKQ